MVPERQGVSTLSKQVAEAGEKSQAWLQNRKTGKWVWATSVKMIGNRKWFHSTQMKSSWVIIIIYILLYYVIFCAYFDQNKNEIHVFDVFKVHPVVWIFSSLSRQSRVSDLCFRQSPGRNSKKSQLAQQSTRPLDGCCCCCSSCAIQCRLCSGVRSPLLYVFPLFKGCSISGGLKCMLCRCKGLFLWLVSTGLSRYRASLSCGWKVCMLGCEVCIPPLQSSWFMLIILDFGLFFLRRELRVSLSVLISTCIFSLVDAGWAGWTTSKVNSLVYFDRTSLSCKHVALESAHWLWVLSICIKSDQTCSFVKIALWDEHVLQTQLVSTSPWVDIEFEPAVHADVFGFDCI